MITQPHPDGTNEITQVRMLLDPVDLTDTVITADAAHAQHQAQYTVGETDRTLQARSRDAARVLDAIPL